MTLETAGSDKLTPAEEAYFASGGANTDGLSGSEPAPLASPESGTPAPAQQPAASSAPATDPAIDDDDLVDREAFDEQGKPKNGGEFIRRANFNVVSNKYKSTKAELKAERESRQKEQAELNEFKQKFARLDERLRLFNEALQPAAQGQQQKAPEPEAPPPDPEQDIFGYARWLGEQNKRLQEQIEQTTKTVGETKQTFQQSTEEQQLRNAYSSDAQRFAVQNPDFGQAYTHYLTVRHGTLEAIGITDEAQRRQIIENEERDIVKRAFQAGKSPAETMYAIAQKVGYQKAAPAAQQEQPPAPAPAVAQPAPAAKPSAVDEVSKLAAAQAASRSLSTAGGSPVIQMSIDQLLAMDDSEFAAYERRNPGVVKQLMGA